MLPTKVHKLPEASMQQFDARLSRRPISFSRTVLTLVFGLIAAWLVRFAVTNPRLEWHVVGEYLFSRAVLHGLLTTIIISCVAQGIGMVIGTIFAACRLSHFWIARTVGTVYVTVVRSVPVLLQLIFWFNLAYLFPTLSLAIPFGPSFHSWPTNDVVTPFVAAMLGLSLTQGAYMTEIIRAGIMSVGQGQHDAARAMGFTPIATFFRVVLPQAVRIIIPPTGSQFITVVHGSSLVSVIGVAELLFSVQNVYERTYQIVPLLLVAVIWYLALVLVLTAFQYRLERRFSRGYTRTGSRRVH